ncbi:MAG: KpsF/GutQ family sugar-phosphate isomerase [Chthonomonadales bacterium]
MSVLERGKTVLREEAHAIAALADRLGGDFVRAAETLLDCRGRVITTGVGKAGAVARKMAATLSSTGTPALFLHPAEGVHGDLGVVTPEDVVIALSYSGESDEVLRLLPSLRRICARLIAVTGNPASTLALAAHIILNVSVPSEACPLGLAPTTSTAAMLALGDALALAVMEARGFTREDFARTHPAGALGRKLTLRVSDVMRTGAQMAVVTSDRLLRDAMFAISDAGAGAALVVDDAGRLCGIITDGDIRRAILKDEKSLSHPVADVMKPKPFVIEGNPLAAEALALFEEHPVKIGEAPVLDAEGRPVGIVMLKDLVRAGIV